MSKKTCPNCGSPIVPVLEAMYQCTVCPWEDYHPDDIDWKARCAALETANAELRAEVGRLWACIRAKVSPSIARHRAIVEAEEAHDLSALERELGVNDE